MPVRVDVQPGRQLARQVVAAAAAAAARLRAAGSGGDGGRGALGLGGGRPEADQQAAAQGLQEVAAIDLEAVQPAGQLVLAQLAVEVEVWWDGLHRPGSRRIVR